MSGDKPKPRVLIDTNDPKLRNHLDDLLTAQDTVEIVQVLPADAIVREPSVDRLSPREKEVLGLIALGNTNKAIATQLGISTHTVNAHRVNLMAKLDLHDAQAVTRFALRNGLIPQV